MQWLKKMNFIAKWSKKNSESADDVHQFLRNVQPILMIVAVITLNYGMETNLLVDPAAKTDFAIPVSTLFAI